MTPMPLELKSLPHRRLEAWKWTDVQARVSNGQKGLSVSALPHFDLPNGVSVSEVDSDDLRTDTPMADLARQLGGKIWQIDIVDGQDAGTVLICLLYTSPSPRDGLLSRMPSSA